MHLSNRLLVSIRNQSKFQVTKKKVLKKMMKDKLLQQQKFGIIKFAPKEALNTWKSLPYCNG